MCNIDVNASYNQQIGEQVGILSSFKVSDRDDIFIKQINIEGVVQNDALAAWRACILYFLHISFSAKSRKEGKIYDTPPEELFLVHMTRTVITNFVNCFQCA